MLKYYSVGEASGYGLSALSYIQALRDNGVELSWYPMTWDARSQAYSYRDRGPGEWERLLHALCASAASCTELIGSEDDADDVLLHTVPEYWPGLREAGRPCIGYTVWETDRVPGHWPALLATADRILTPSSHSKSALESTGCERPVRVVPHMPSPGIESDQVDARYLDQVLPADHHVFYTINAWQPRKGMEMLLHAFLLAFTAKDPVVLYVKTLPLAVEVGNPDGWVDVVELVESIQSNYSNAARVIIDTQARSGAEIAALHRRGQCYVSLARAEGWGMAAFDAAWTGTPVIMTGYGGQLDFLDRRYCQLVDYELTPVKPNRLMASYSTDQKWAEPGLDSAIAAMREIVEDPRRASRNAGQLAALVRTRFSPAETLRRLREAIDD